MQITEQIIERIARKVFNAMFPQALRSSNVVTGSSGGGSVQHAVEADHATTADSATTAGSADAVAWSGVSNKPDTATRWPAWGEVTGKPDTATRWPAWSEVTGKPSFADVATSGNYNDLSNKPSIPSVSGSVSGSTLTITINGTAYSLTDTNTWRPLGTGATDAAAGNHNHDGTYLKLSGGTITNDLVVNGSVGIGTSTLSQKLNVSGRIACTSGFSFQSDIRKKNVIDREVKLSIDNIADAPLIHYTLKDGTDKDTHVGSVAQYWATVLPETVQKDKQGYLSMQYDVQALASAVVLAREVRELKKQIEELRNEHKQ